MNQLTKLLFIGITVFGLYLSSTAHPIDMQTARSIAAKFMGTNELQLATTYKTDKNADAIYVFNTADGFVIVAADDCETPIIGYSHEGRFDPNNVPVQMEDYLQDFVARINYGKENHIEADERTAKQWELVKAAGRLNNRDNAKSVEPLLTEKWHQGCLYNSLCPTMNGPCDHAEAGCIAVAMGQIMHYWQYPSSGWDSHSYSNAGLTLSADFGNTVYDWGHMPDSLTDESSDAEIEAVATLLFHCGVSVDMKYTNNGSGAYSNDVPNALIRYFNYSRRMHFEKRSNFSDEEWMSMLRNCLDQQRPIFYAGKGGQGSHAFVCDGYDINNLLHFNWGWGLANGYFALGSLNPLEYSFNEMNFAIFDIYPEYEPWSVNATPYPPTAGTIEGNGEYHIGEQCTLTATPVENSKFCYWKKGDNVVCYETTYSFLVNNDVDNIVAIFSYKPVMEIMAHHAPDTNDMSSPYVSLSWSFDSNLEWNLLKQFEIDGETYVTTNGEYIFTAYASYSDYPGTFGKYTIDGELVEFFNIDGARPDGLTSDGTFFYCSKNHSSYDIHRLYRFDFENKTLIDSTYMNMQFGLCAYGANYDSFCLLKYVPHNTISLVNREGQTIYNIPIPSSLQYSINGFGPITSNDGNQHLLITANRTIYDYNIDANSLNEHRIAHLGNIGNPESTCFGKYDDKDALYVIAYTYDIDFNAIYSIYIYEINCHLAPIQHYRLYRADSEGHLVLLADEFTGTSFTDDTWVNATAGTYRFGISEVYHNGIESETSWSDTIVKTGFGIHENEGHQDTHPSVQKVVEDGKIVIIKEGKRYSLSGQILN